MEEKERERRKAYKPRPKTLIFCGNSRLPENVTAKHVFGFFSIELEVDPVDFKIIDASCTLLPSLGEKVLLNALVGHKIEEGIENAVSEIEGRFFSTTKRAIIAAIEDAYKRYEDYLKEAGVERK
jgi:hypothetical protein